MRPIQINKIAELDRRIQKAIDDAIELANLGDSYVPAGKIAERLFDTEPELMAEVQRPWSVERLTWMISRRRRTQRLEERPGQMLLDPMFKTLPRTIFLRDGRRPKMDYCTVSETSEHLRLLRERMKNHPRVAQFEAAVALHKKWAAIEKGITWGEAKRREAEQREKELLRG